MPTATLSLNPTLFGVVIPFAGLDTPIFFKSAASGHLQSVDAVQAVPAKLITMQPQKTINFKTDKFIFVILCQIKCN
jgi:hypothetical protein